MNAIISNGPLITIRSTAYLELISYENIRAGSRYDKIKSA